MFVLPVKCHFTALALNTKIANIVVRLATMAMLLFLSSLAGYAIYVPTYLSCCVNLYLKAEQTGRSQKCLPADMSESSLFRIYLKCTVSYVVK